MRPILLLLALLLPFAVSAQTRPASEVYRVTERGGGLGVGIDQTVTFSKVGASWIAERTREDSNWCGKHPAADKCEATKTKRHDRIDGASCPRLAEALRALSIVPLPTFADPDAFEYFTASDISLLTVEGWPHVAGPIADRPWQQHIAISEYTGPFRAWWKKTEEALAPCWSPVAGA